MKQTENIRPSGHYPRNDLTYDVISILHHKSKGLELLDPHLSDAQGTYEVKELIERIQRQDEECIGEFEQCLISLPDNHEVRDHQQQ